VLSHNYYGGFSPSMSQRMIFLVRSMPSKRQKLIRLKKFFSWIIAGCAAIARHFTSIYECIMTEEEKMRITVALIKIFMIYMSMWPHNIFEMKKSIKNYSLKYFGIKFVSFFLFTPRDFFSLHTHFWGIFGSTHIIIKNEWRQCQ
jgi:hypothetical protein